MIGRGRWRQRLASRTRNLVAVGTGGYGSACVMAKVGETVLILRLVLPVALGRREVEG